MDMGCKFGPTLVDMKEIGLKEKLKEKASLFMKTVIYTKENGKMTKLQV
jgi:hypothetical protein